MKILRTYILQEHAAPFLIALCSLTGVLLIGNLVKFAELVIGKGINPLDILRLLVYLIPFLLVFTVPMACLIAMILAFGRLSTDYELIAIRASGVAPIRLVWPMLVLAAILSAAMLVIHDRIAPASHQAMRQQLKAIGIKQPTTYLEAGTFIKAFPPYIIFVYQVQGKTMQHVRIYQPQPEGPTRTIIAEHGEFEQVPGSRPRARLKLYDGTLDEWDPLHPGSLYKVSFNTYSMDLDASSADPERVGKKLKEFTFRELVAERRRLSKQDIETVPLNLELHRRIASSFATCVFVLFGLAFGLRLHHHERLTSFLWVLAIFIAYYLGSVGMSAVALKGWTAPWLAMWTPNVIGLAIGGALLWRAVRR